MSTSAPWHDERCSPRWRRIAEVRAEANRHIEALRAEGKLGSSLQAEVTIKAGPKRLAELAALGDDLRFVLITSRATVESAGDTADASEFFVHAAVSERPKCERCWHYRDDVGVEPAHPTICGRCVANLYGAGEPRTRRLMAAQTRRLAPALARHRRRGDRPRPAHQDLDHDHPSSSATRAWSRRSSTSSGPTTGRGVLVPRDASGWQRWFFIGLGIVAAGFIVWLLKRHAASASSAGRWR